MSLQSVMESPLTIFLFPQHRGHAGWILLSSARQPQVFCLPSFLPGPLIVPALSCVCISSREMWLPSMPLPSLQGASLFRVTVFLPSRGLLPEVGTTGTLQSQEGQPSRRLSSYTDCSRLSPVCLGCLFCPSACLFQFLFFFLPSPLHVFFFFFPGLNARLQTVASSSTTTQPPPSSTPPCPCPPSLHHLPCLHYTGGEVPVRNEQGPSKARQPRVACMPRQRRAFMPSMGNGQGGALFQVWNPVCIMMVRLTWLVEAAQSLGRPHQMSVLPFEVKWLEGRELSLPPLQKNYELQFFLPPSMFIGREAGCSQRVEMDGLGERMREVVRVTRGSFLFHSTPPPPPPPSSMKEECQSSFMPLPTEA